VRHAPRPFLAIVRRTDDIFPHSAVEAPALPQGRHNEAACFLSCILEGTPPAGMVGPQVCCDAQEVLEAGARAIMEQRVVPLLLG
jgi:predicted dehydrogenase